jgi:formate/nitrite transporter FocA (FNT family)
VVLINRKNSYHELNSEKMNDRIETLRTFERSEEDVSYTPVIIKRNDLSIRHPDDTIEWAIRSGMEQHNRPNFSLFLSSFSAGAILSFAAMCIALINQLVPVENNEILSRLANAFVYPLGFIICIMSGLQLFTEQTATALYPVLDGKSSVNSLLKLWGIVLIGNFVGTFLGSVLLYFADPVIGAADGFIEISKHLFDFTLFEVFISAVLAGWLMAQSGWLIVSTSSASSQIIFIYIATFIIGFGGLHHSIAGSAEIFSGLLHSNNPNLLAASIFLIIVVFGNIFGGGFFVAILNYGHIRKTQCNDKKNKFRKHKRR